jgi:hypothetical protein
LELSFEAFAATSEQPTKHRRIDFSQFQTVEEVEAYVASQLVAIRKLLDVPWMKGGCYILDVDKVKLIIDAQTTSNIAPTSPRPSPDKPKNDQVDCHILIPFSSMIDWITSSMNCKRCRGTIKAKYISKTTVVIATELHFSHGSKTCESRKKPQW